MPVSYGDDKSLIVSLSCESGSRLDSVVGCRSFVLQHVKHRWRCTYRLLNRRTLLLAHIFRFQVALPRRVRFEARCKIIVSYMQQGQQYLELEEKAAVVWSRDFFTDRRDRTAGHRFRFTGPVGPVTGKNRPNSNLNSKPTVIPVSNI